jgi:hypothetical protein
VPASVPVRLVAAVLNADVKVAFEQVARPTVKLSGVVETTGVKVVDLRTQDLLAFDGLKVTVDDVRPLEQVVKIALLELSAPRLAVSRDKAGNINLQLQQPSAPNASASANPGSNPGKNQNTANNIASNEGRTLAAANSPPKTEPWKVVITELAVRGGTVSWRDDTTAPQARMVLRDVVVDAQAIALPFAAPLQFSGTAALAGADKGLGPDPKLPQDAGAAVTFSGTATDQAATVNASVKDVRLALAAPYLAQFVDPSVEPSLAGSLSTDVAVNWKPSELKLGVKLLTLNNLALLQRSAAKVAVKNAAKTSAALASIKKLEIADAQIDLGPQKVTVGRVTIDQPAASVERDAQKRWMFERWVKSGPGPGATSAPASAKLSAPPPAQSPKPVASGQPAAKPWSVVVADLSVNGGAFDYRDNANARPVAFDVSALKAQVKGFSMDAKQPFPLTASARIRAVQGEFGQLDYRGNLGLVPLSAQGKVVAAQIPVHAFEPYFGDALNIELLRADAGFKGDVRFVNGTNGPSVKVTGDSVVEEFRANSASPKLTGQTDLAPPGPSVPLAQGKPGGAGDLKISEELLSWKALSLRGVDVTVAPGSATTVSVTETALTDFFARVLINETGRINLQDLVKSSAAPEGAGPSGSGGSAPASNATNKIATNEGGTLATARNEGSPAGAANPPDPVINIGPISLVNGKVYFSDRFVRPNYSANLSELTGKLSAFSSVAGQGSPPSAPQMADLELRGRVEGTASLEILGKLNPLAKPLALDIKGKVRDLELAPLSPYSVKYAGYGIERGKLSVDVGYLVLPDGNLTATNNIILNQLTFGDKVEGAPASLPVKLAVALLADRNGVIDINLPVSGSLNDPQFKLGPIIFKVIVNLIVKAITSPFSLLASAFGGGGDELSMVAFAPGTAALGPDARAGLDKVAKALTDRPGLKMTVVGSANLEAEREPYKRERLKALLQAEKRRAAAVGGAAPAVAVAIAAPASAASAVAIPASAPAMAAALTDAETPALLKEVYRRADVPKPRNLIGVAKDIPAGEMEALLLANIAVTEDAMRELALQRGVAVKEYLADKQLPPERLFLGAAKPGAVDAKWTPRAELNLLTN